MKRIRSLVIAAVALAGVNLLAVPSANAGSVGVSVNIGNGGYYNRPVYYQPRPYYARPVYPAYYRKPGHGYYHNPAYYRAPVYSQRPVHYYRR